MYESDECQKDCKCYTCLKGYYCGRDCSHPFNCKLMTVKCTSQRELGQYECTVIAGPDTGTQGIIVKENTLFKGGLNAVRLPDGRIIGLREDEIIRD